MAAALSALPWFPGRAGAEPRAEPAAGSDATLLAVALAVLPESLGAERVREVANRFQAWLRAYRPDAELDHGYGHPRLQSTGASPAGGHDRQLAALEAQARAEGATVFARLSVERQRALLAAALAAEKITDLPERPDGRHVATDLLAFFFRSSEASDLCYGAAIGRDTCRGLPGSDEAPARLELRS